MKPIDFNGKAWYVTDLVYNERLNYFQMVEVRSITPLHDHHATINYLGGSKILLMNVDNPNLFNKVVDAEKQAIELNISRARKGYMQYWCPNGHFWETQGFYGDGKCPHCNRRAKQFNEVDNTNCEHYGYVEPVVLEPAVKTKCECCDHESVLRQAVHRIPTEDELLKLQQYRDSDNVWHFLKDE